MQQVAGASIGSRVFARQGVASWGCRGRMGHPHFLGECSDRSPGTPRLTCCRLHHSLPRTRARTSLAPCGVEVPQGQVVLAVGLGHTPVVRGSRVRQKRVPPFPRLEAGVTLSHPPLPGRKQESHLSQGWHGLRGSSQLSFSLIPPGSALRQPLKPEGVGTFTPES